MKRPLSRRRFLQATGVAAAAAAVGGPALILPACAKSGDFDLVVAGGLLYDGLGGPPVQADVGIRGDVIQAVGRLSHSRRTAVIENNKWTEGLDVLEASKRAGKGAYEFMRDLIIEERDVVGMVLFMMSEDNLKRILAHPLVGIGSDSSVRAPYGILSTGKPHPRAYGTFPRILAKYVREDKIEAAETMIMKMTSRAAAKFGLAGRGFVKPGACADLVVVSGGEHTGKLPGRVLRKAKPA